MSTIFFLLSGVCHQYASRSFSFQWQPLPLCARCMGTFLGLSVTLLTLMVIRTGRKSGWPVWPIWVLGAFFFGLWILDSVNSTMSWTIGDTLYSMSTKSERLIIGMGNGLAWGLLVAPLANGLIWRDADPAPILNHLWQMMPSVAILAGLAWLLVAWRRAPYLLWLVIVSVSALGTLSIINGLLVLIITRRDSRLTRWIQTMPFLLGGLLLSLVELGAVAFLRRKMGV